MTRWAVHLRCATLGLLVQTPHGQTFGKRRVFRGRRFSLSGCQGLKLFAGPARRANATPAAREAVVSCLGFSVSPLGKRPCLSRLRRRAFCVGAGEEEGRSVPCCGRHLLPVSDHAPSGPSRSQFWARRIDRRTAIGRGEIETQRRIAEHSFTYQAVPAGLSSKRQSRSWSPRPNCGRSSTMASCGFRADFAATKLHRISRSSGIGRLQGR